MKTSREHILEYLQTKRAATPLEIARALHLTTANIRHHLSILLKEGVIKPVGQRQEDKPGRPTRIYALAQQTGAHYLDGLASLLLEELRDLVPPSGQEAFLGNLAKRLASPCFPSSQNQSQRFRAAVQRLNEMNYQARWEAHSQSPRLILGHCPYAAIISDHPELCRVDAYLLEEMLGAPVIQIAKQEPTPLGLPQCIFRLKG